MTHALFGSFRISEKYSIPLMIKIRGTKLPTAFKRAKVLSFHRYLKVRGLASVPSEKMSSELGDFHPVVLTYY